jgi:CMP-N,N'-diacetyllegionaminic acid synthase
MIAIIPARSGSKGIPNKNIMDFNGKPLIYNTIKAAKNSNMIDRVFVSTDSKEIAEISMSYGAESPFLRPPELAEDTSLLNDTLKFMIQRLELTFAKALDSIIVLQPTSPLRNNDDIDNAINLFYEKGADSVISYVQASQPISWHKGIGEDGQIIGYSNQKFSNRQDHTMTYYPNGAIYILSRKMIFSDLFYSKKTYAYLMPKERSVDIDDLSQFRYAEYLAREQI